MSKKITVSNPCAASSALSLEAIRNVLTRLEETIIFGLIERAQFRYNPIIYVPGGAGPALRRESLVGFLLHELEKANALVRRYLSPDEVPFTHGLPAPILPRIAIPNPLHPHRRHLNAEIRAVYQTEIVPQLCEPGDDAQWGSSAVQDVALLQALSKRIHYGRFVAESKYRKRPRAFHRAIRSQDEAALMEMITDPDMEERVLARVYRKASIYGRELDSGPGRHKVPPRLVREIYARWIIPLNKRAQVLYLLERM